MFSFYINLADIYLHASRDFFKFGITYWFYWFYVFFKNGISVILKDSLAWTIYETKLSLPITRIVFKCSYIATIIANLCLLWLIKQMHFFKVSFTMTNTTIFRKWIIFFYNIKSSLPNTIFTYFFKVIPNIKFRNRRWN